MNLNPQIQTHKIAEAHQGEKSGFDMGSLRERRGYICDGGSVRGSSEAEMGLVAWIEGREERFGLRENEEKKKSKGGRGRGGGVGVEERVNQKK